MTGRNAGVTLLELLVAITVLGIAMTIAGVAVRDPSHGAIANAPGEVADLRREALRQGARVTRMVHMDGHASMMTALPDGRVLAPPQDSVDLLTGRRHAPR